MLNLYQLYWTFRHALRWYKQYKQGALLLFVLVIFVRSCCSVVEVHVLHRLLQRLRFLQTDHECWLPAHWLRRVPRCVVHSRSRQRAQRHSFGLLMRMRVQTELLLLLLLQVSQDGFGQEVRVIFMLICNRKEKSLTLCFLNLFLLFDDQITW